MTQLITLSSAAKRLGMSPRTAYNRLYAGNFPIPTAKVGKERVVREDQLNAFIDALLPPPASITSVEPPPPVVKRGPGAPRKLAKQSTK